MAAVAAQLTTTTRGAGAWAFGTLGVSYLLRAIGDTASGAASWLTWLSPLGWAEKIEVFGEDRFVVAVLPLVVTVLLIALAYALQERRDFGSGLLPSRPGPADAAPSCARPGRSPGGCSERTCWAGSSGTPSWEPSSARWPEASPRSPEASRCRSRCASSAATPLC